MSHDITGFRYRGLSPHKFTPMPGVHKKLGDGKPWGTFVKKLPDVLPPDLTTRNRLLAFHVPRIIGIDLWMAGPGQRWK
jgi:hypothetical protein